MYKNLICSLCGCVGFHACTKYPIVWTKLDKEKLQQVLDKFSHNNKDNKDKK